MAIYIAALKWWNRKICHNVDFTNAIVNVCFLLLPWLQFFKWADEVTSSSSGCHGDQCTSQTKLKSTSDLIGYSAANGIQVYPGCELIG